MDYLTRLLKRVSLPLSAFREPKPLTKEEGQQLASLINRREFRLLEKYLVWKIAVKNAEGMRSGSDAFTHDRKVEVNVLKEIPYDLRNIWLSAQPKKPETPIEDKEFRIFRDEDEDF